jgi:predicted RNase H-like nuclease (RuvC/YqgF family)
MDKQKKRFSTPILERRISANNKATNPNSPDPEELSALFQNSAKLLEQQQAKIEKLGCHLLKAQNMIDSMRRRHDMALEMRDHEIELLRCTIEKSKAFLD